MENCKTMKDKNVPYKQITTLFLVVLFVSAIFSGCTKKNEDLNKVETVKIGMVSFVGYAPLYLAKEKNFFNNLDVKLHRIEAIGDIRAAMESGKIDIYAATYDIFQTTENTSPPGIGFLAMDESNGADGIIVSENINTIEDLKGKTVGAEPGLPPYFILQYMLNKANLTLKDVQFRDISSQDVGNTFVAKMLDVAGTYEPFLSKSRDLREGSKVLVSSKDTPGLIADLLFASPELVNNNPDTLKKITEGWFKAVEYWQAHPDEAMGIMSKAFGVSKEELIDIKSNLKWLTKKDNIELFDQNEKNNVFSTFDLVSDILEKNGSAGFKVYAKDKLTSKVVNSFK